MSDASLKQGAELRSLVPPLGVLPSSPEQLERQATASGRRI